MDISQDPMQFIGNVSDYIVSRAPPRIHGNTCFDASETGGGSVDLLNWI
jgi:hypothetical protein